MATPPPIHKQASKLEDQEMLPIEVGQSIWVPSTGEAVWERGTVMAIGGLKVTVRTQAGKIQQVDRGLSLPQNPRVADDMTALYYIHEAGVLHNLAERSKLDGPDGSGQKPYTFMANVLIAVNPLRDVPDPRISEIVANPGALPHPFAVAEMAYQQMVFNSGTEQPTNQSVVISGESGAGKTESSKIVLRHLTTRGLYGKNAKPGEIEARYAQDHKNGAGNSNSLDARLIEQNPILEAFGNAKTLRNHNSSRFGKFMKLQFTQNGQFQLAGAFVETYLLEKSRLAYQVSGERNFHIFYQLLSGASPAMKKEFSLTKPEDYDYLNQSGCYIAEDTDDKADFAAVVRGLSCVGMNDATQHSVFSVIAGLLHLGNVDMDEEDTAEGEVAVIEKPSAVKALALAAQLLGVTKEGLERVITVRDIVTRNETFNRRQNVQEATYGRDAIAKALYGRLFDWVIEQVNKSLGQDPAPLPYIGVLDIFGFESFQRNDYEQLLINYTNEVLQATFNQQVFIAEMELYKREGITVGKIQWPDNRECVELIASKPDGILVLLDAEAMNPKPSDDKFLATLHRTHAKNPYFLRPHPKDMKVNFIVRHFAGAVSYSIGEFMNKNNDSIPQDMTNLFLGSSSKLVVSLFKSNDDADARPGKKKVLKSVAAKFSLQMQELVDTLDSTRCNFIRCIKPNALMRVGSFDPRYVVGQLRCQGIMQTAQVLKVGLPTRVPYSELVGAYKKFMPPDAQRLFASQSDPTLITAILWAFQVPMDAYKLGITRLFFRAGKIALLDAILKINWAVDGPRIVGRMKLWLARRRWRVGLAKVVSQNSFKKLLRRIQARRDAIVRIQQWWRGLGVRRQFKKTKSAAVVVQALFRGHKARILFKTKKQEMIAIAEARAAEMRRQAEEAKRREEEARRAAEAARRESIARAMQEEDRRRMEEEARKAEEEAIRAAELAAAAVREAEAAVAEATAAAEHERQAELRAIAEARELELRIQREREEAERRKEEALLRAASVSANLLGGLAQIQTLSGAAGEVNIVEIPDDLSQENKEQLQQLSELLLSGAISQSEYDELVPFLLERPVDVPSGAQLTAEQEESLSRLYSAGVYGIQIRCPACGATNNTAYGNHCESCGSLLTTSDEAAGQDMYGGYRPRSVSRPGGALSILTSPVGSFGMEGHRIVIHDGYLQVQMHRTQVLQDDNYAEYTVYVLRCQWSPKDGSEPTTWLVSHRFSVFERLHKDLKHKIPPTVATLPHFPRKHRLGGVFGGKTGNSTEIVEERKKGLESYVGQVLDICARLPGSLTVPELDRFLNLSRQVEQYRRHLAAAATAAAGGTDPTMPAYQGPASGAEALAARELSRLPTELPTPFDEEELAQTEHAVSMLEQAIRNSRGDLRRDATVQHHLKVCVQLLPRLQISANLDNPFANVDLIPRAMQCQEDLETTMNLYNDSLLAVSETYMLSAQEAGGNVAVPPPYVPGQQNSYQRSYGV